MVRPIYEARIRIAKTGATISSIDTELKPSHHGSGIIYKRVLRYPPKRIGEETTYDFGSIILRLIERGTPHLIVDVDGSMQEKEIWIGGVKAGGGRELAGKVFFLNGMQLEHPDIIMAEPIAETLHHPDDKHKIITYYAPKGGSFGFISEKHLKYLPKVGLNIYRRTSDQLLWDSQHKKTHWGLLHPVFYEFQRFQRFRNMGGRASIATLKRYHDNVGGFDVADSDRISKFAVDLANKMDLIMVPSEHSKKAYRESSVESRVEVVPHGVSELYNAPPNPFKKIPCHGGIKKEIPENDVTILFFMLHSPYRKGADIVYKAMSRILHDRPDVHLIVKSVGMNKLHKLPRSMYISGWLTEEDIIRLYDTADILLSPSRGGGYEHNVCEGLARGLVAVTSDWPAILEHAEPYALVTKNTGKKVKPLYNNPIHTGYGTDPDPEHFHEQIEYAIDNLDSLKKKGRCYAKEIRKKYSWKNTAKRIAEILA